MMEIEGHNITIGADPELFIGKGGNMLSAFGLIPGTKQQPFKVEKGAVQVDGMAAEFNIEPADNGEEFLHNIREVQRQLAEMLPEGTEFLKAASVMVSDDVFKSQPMAALELGCDPDFNCYTMGINPKPDMWGQLRTVGGHIHVGGFNTDDIYNLDHFMSMGRLTSLIDESVGVFSLLWDKDARRREMYGAAGAFRPKHYGMEWRSASSMWTFDDNLVKFVFDQTVKAVKRFFDKDYTPHPEVQDIINNNHIDHPLITESEEYGQLKGILEA